MGVSIRSAPSLVAAGRAEFWWPGHVSRIDGKPRQRHVAFIASYEAKKLDQIGTRSTFWRHARQRLDQIGNQITPADRSKIEAALAQRVQPTTGRAGDGASRYPCRFDACRASHVAKTRSRHPDWGER